MTKSAPASDGWSSSVFGRQGDAASSDAVRVELVNIFDTIDLPVVVVGRDFRVACFNRAATAAFGLTPSHIGQSPYGIGVFGDVIELEKLCAQVIADGAPCRREVRHGDRWFLLRVAPYIGGDDRNGGIVLTLTNVTAFRASIEQAIHEREFTKAILNTVIEPLVVLDAGLRVQTANRAFYAMFQVSRDETHDVPLDALPNHPWEASRLWPLLKELLFDNKEFETLEIDHEFPVIGRRTLLVDARRLTREGRPEKLILLALRDISERKQAEESLQEADRRKDEFLATLAHELRNPLAPIENSLHLLRLSGDLSPSLDPVREIMERQVDQMVRLIDDLLEVSRISSGKIELRKELIELATIMTSAVETVQPLIDAAGHQLALSLPAEPIMLNADPVRLAQIIGNLLNNAAKYTKPGGQIWLTARIEGNEAMISIRDTGLGIPADMLPRVFDMFIQVDRTLTRAQGGLGIGLTLTKTFVEMHDGRIEVYSDGADQGSNFVVHLPMIRDSQRRSPRLTAVRSSRTSYSRRRILIVDDTRSAGYILGKLLETLGQQVYTANNATAALEIARTERPELVISDIAMPGMDGYELAQRLRTEASLEGVLLVALTGYGQESDKQRANEAGFNYHLVKPVSLEALQDLLASVAEIGTNRPDSARGEN